MSTKLKLKLKTKQVIRKYNFIEICAGSGGLSSGLIEAGFTPLLLNDIDKDCCKTLSKNHEGTNIVLGSFTDIDFTNYIDKIDLLAGGVPCQSFSQAGQRKGFNDSRGDLMLSFIDLCKLIRPKIFMIENVKGLLTHNSGKTFESILKKIEDIGIYNIVYKCLDASKYGVPQKRERIFIIATLKLLKPFSFPTEHKNITTLRNCLTNVPQSQGSSYPKEKIELFKLIKEGGCWVDLPLDLQKKYLGNSFYSGGGKRGILHRLSMDKPCLTLLCSPSQKQTDRCHPLEERPLTIREYARIQTFSDTYEFIGSISSQYKQIGNAVPVLLAKQIGEELINILD